MLPRTNQGVVTQDDAYFCLTGLTCGIILYSEELVLPSIFICETCYKYINNKKKICEKK